MLMRWFLTIVLILLTVAAVGGAIYWASVDLATQCHDNGAEHQDKTGQQGIGAENPLWGAPRIHGELLKLGFDVAQSSVANGMDRPCSRRQRHAESVGGLKSTRRTRHAQQSRHCSRTHHWYRYR